MKWIISLILVIMFPGSITAQSLKLPTIVYIGAASADLGTTYVGLRNGGHEENPYVQWLHDKPGPVLVFGVVSDTVGLVLWDKYMGRSHPKVAIVTMYLVSGVRIGLAIHNYKVYNELRGNR